MIGPTGVGKTEIARRLAKLANAPFIKVEATKFTEVGYVGRDVESIIRDLADVALKDARELAMQKLRNRAEDAAEERVLDVLLPPASSVGFSVNETPENSTRQKFRKKLREGDLDDKEIEIDVSLPTGGVEIMAPPGMEEMSQQLQGMFQNLGGDRKKKRKMPIKEAMKLLIDEEAAKDKVARGGERSSSADVSRDGVQRDLLPLIEGSTVSTKFGMIKTDHILFIACGAFHLSKPSDLIPELQGRLPIRVELDALTTPDFVRILSEPDASLTEQAVALLGTEDVNVTFTDDGLSRIAEVAWQVNESTENIGARRLHTVMERLLESASFDASEKSGATLNVNADYVNDHLGDLVEDVDLSRYIL